MRRSILAGVVRGMAAAGVIACAPGARTEIPDRAPELRRDPPGWTLDTTASPAEFRGLHAADARVVWAAGRNGAIARSTDGGRSWRTDSIPGAAALFLVDVHAVDASTAYVLGTSFEGGLARIYRTTDGGARWTIQYSDSSTGVFFDGMAFWDSTRGIAFSDPVGGSFLVVRTTNGGASWKRVPPERLPPPLAGEAAFAASGTAIAVQGRSHVWFGTGGGATARVYRSSDGGATWRVASTPLAGSQTAGIFGLAFRDTLNGVAVGGDYRQPGGAGLNVLRTSDGGATWALVSQSSPAGVRYGVAYVPGARTPTIVAVGPSGSGYSADEGRTWVAMDTIGYNTVHFANPGAAWAAGPRGRLARTTGALP